MRTAWLCCLSVLAWGCSTTSQPSPAQRSSVVVQENNVPGTVNHPWVEPMYDTAKVPAQIDPTNTYYRPSHQTVVEIRPERFENVRYGDEKKQEQQQQGGQ